MCQCFGNALKGLDTKQTYRCVLLQIPEAHCLVGKNKIPRCPIWFPINKQFGDTRSFTAQSL